MTNAKAIPVFKNRLWNGPIHRLIDAMHDLPPNATDDQIRAEVAASGDRVGMDPIILSILIEFIVNLIKKWLNPSA
jgi:hypothetical protein